MLMQSGTQLRKHGLQLWPLRGNCFRAELPNSVFEEILDSLLKEIFHSVFRGNLKHRSRSAPGSQESFTTTSLNVSHWWP